MPPICGESETKAPETHKNRKISNSLSTETVVYQHNMIAEMEFNSSIFLMKTIAYTAKSPGLFLRPLALSEMAAVPAARHREHSPNSGLNA